MWVHSVMSLVQFSPPAMPPQRLAKHREGPGEKCGSFCREFRAILPSRDAATAARNTQGGAGGGFIFSIFIS